MRPVSSWGRLSALPHDVIALSDRSRVATELARDGRGIAYGLGRSYGDACLNPHGVLWNTSGLDRFIRFDEESGRLVCEAGVVLREIQRLVIPRGWGLPVLPGTQFVTVGGAIANDVHGKNHHETGTFGDHVKSLRMLRTDGQEIVCGPAERPDWFAATVGGLGLTGLIVEAELQLRRLPGPWLDAETIAYSGLDEFFRLSGEFASRLGTCRLLDRLHRRCRARPVHARQAGDRRASNVARSAARHAAGAAGLAGQSADSQAVQSSLLDD